MSQLQTVSINISERYAIINLVPVKGSYNEYLLRQDLVEKFLPTEKEEKQFGIIEVKEGDGLNIKWDLDKVDGVLFDIELSEIEVNIITKALIELDEQKGITKTTGNLYKIFVLRNT